MAARIGVVAAERLTGQVWLRAIGSEAIDPVTLDPDDALDPSRQPSADLEAVLVVLGLGDETRKGLSRAVPRLADDHRVVIATGAADEAELGGLLEAGARGLVSFDTAVDVLQDVLVRVAAGEFVPGRERRAELISASRRRREDRQRAMRRFDALTMAERRVLGALARGGSAAAIAEEQVVSVLTIRAHVRSILAKLGVQSQLAAVTAAHEAGWRWDAPPDPS